MHRHSMAAFAALAVVLAAGCGPKADAGGAATSAVKEIELGRRLNADKSLGDKTETFLPSDTVYVVIDTDAPGALTLTARWSFEEGQLVDESSQTVAATGKARTEFHIAKLDGFPTGKYKVEVTVDGKPAGSEEFTVKR